MRIFTRANLIILVSSLFISFIGTAAQVAAAETPADDACHSAKFCEVCKSKIKDGRCVVSGSPPTCICNCLPPEGKIVPEFKNNCIIDQ